MKTKAARQSCEACGGSGLLRNGERCDLCERFPGDDAARAAFTDENNSYLYEVTLKVMVSVDARPSHPYLKEILVENALAYLSVLKHLGEEQGAYETHELIDVTPN